MGENDAFPWQLTPPIKFLSFSLRLSSSRFYLFLASPSCSPPFILVYRSHLLLLLALLAPSCTLCLSLSLSLSLSSSFSLLRARPHQLSATEENYSLSILEAQHSPTVKPTFSFSVSFLFTATNSLTKGILPLAFLFRPLFLPFSNDSTL